MDDQFSAGRDFILRQGRLLERRLFATCFESAPASGVIDAVTAFRNDDGGFGHGLEPDIRCPASLPVDVDVALQALATVSAVDRALVLAAASTWPRWRRPPGGAAPYRLRFPVIEGFPRAAHWTDWTYEPSLNPTAGLVGHLKRLGVEHPGWTKRPPFAGPATGLGLPTDAHALSEVFVFLEQAPAGERSSAVADRVVDSLAGASSWRADPDDPGYGLTPLTIAPLAGSPWRQLFPEDLLAGHLDRLQRDQQPTAVGRSPGNLQVRPRSWMRGVVTLAALRTLVSYGRSTAPLASSGRRFHDRRLDDRPSWAKIAQLGAIEVENRQESAQKPVALSRWPATAVMRDAPCAMRHAQWAVLSVPWITAGARSGRYRPD